MAIIPLVPALVIGASSAIAGTGVGAFVGSQIDDIIDAEFGAPAVDRRPLKPTDGDSRSLVGRASDAIDDARNAFGLLGIAVVIGGVWWVSKGMK